MLIKSIQTHILTTPFQIDVFMMKVFTKEKVIQELLVKIYLKDSI